MSIYITKTKIMTKEICEEIRNIINRNYKLEIVELDNLPNCSGYQEIINSVNSSIEKIKSDTRITDNDYIVSINHGIGSFVNRRKKEEETVKNKLIERRNKKEDFDLISEQNFILLFYVNITKSRKSLGTFSTSIPIKVENIRKSVKERIDILDTYDSIDTFSGISTDKLVLFTFELLWINFQK